MRIPARFQVGVATHTGLVRSANEDDFLVVAPPDGGALQLCAAIADGMGGVAGGAEASRAGLRGFAAGLLRDGRAATAAAVTRGFAGASERVHEQATLVPALREMGTTLTALAFERDRAVLGHVGDSRAYLLRQGELRQLSQDHSVAGQQNRLLRCIGGGMAETAPDLLELDLQTGDRFLLCSDGVWGPVAPARLLELLARHPAAPAAERLVAAALAAGGPDNCTALVVHVVEVAPDAPAAEVALPVQEASRRGELVRRGRLGAARWPWLLVALTLLLAAALVAHWWVGFDPLQWFRGWR
ncbi:MAG: PP2C family serine/threonine-protein phosphatase [Planctomycetota bacterium]